MHRLIHQARLSLRRCCLGEIKCMSECFSSGPFDSSSPLFFFFFFFEKVMSYSWVHYSIKKKWEYVTASASSASVNMISHPPKQAVRGPVGLILCTVIVSSLLFFLGILHRVLHLSQITERDKKKKEKQIRSLFVSYHEWNWMWNEVGVLRQTKLKH